MKSKVRLTQYSHGAGCGCKIAPNVLTSILNSSVQLDNDPRLIVGNQTRDDAAVYDLGDGTALISTTDFFMPIVDDPFTFGRIAAINALSDVYAMGGTPILAIAILGWPVDKLDPDIARQVVDGGRQACKDAGIQLAGGHSIDSPEPIFGLAVNGRVDLKKLKRNDGAHEGDLLYLTKPLGVGLLTTAEKNALLRREDKNTAVEIMASLNKVGSQLADFQGVHAMTDVTGFSLAGHLSELCEGSKLSAEISFESLPKIEAFQYYIDKKCMPGGTGRNWASYKNGISLADENIKFLICDPQTSGGLLLAVDPSEKEKVESLLQNEGLYANSIGHLVKKSENLIRVK